MLGVPADEGEEDPRSEERRLGVPALLRKISPGRNAAGQEQEEQGGGEAGEPVHCDNKLKIIRRKKQNKYKWVLRKSYLFPLRGHHREAKSVQQLLTCCDNTAKLSFKGVGCAAILKGMA